MASWALFASNDHYLKPYYILWITIIEIKLLGTTTCIPVTPAMLPLLLPPIPYNPVLCLSPLSE